MLDYKKKRVTAGREIDGKPFKSDTSAAEHARTLSRMTLGNFLMKHKQN